MRPNAAYKSIRVDELASVCACVSHAYYLPNMPSKMRRKVNKPKENTVPNPSLGSLICAHSQSMAFIGRGVIVMIVLYGEFCLLWRNLKTLQSSQRRCLHLARSPRAHANRSAIVHGNLLTQPTAQVHLKCNQNETIVHFALIHIVYFIS